MTMRRLLPYGTMGRALFDRIVCFRTLFPSVRARTEGGPRSAKASRWPALSVVVAAQTPESEKVAGVLSLVLLVIFVLALLVLLVTFICVRAARRQRRMAQRRRAKPTEADDVWAMHKLPEGAEDHLDDPDDQEW